MASLQHRVRTAHGLLGAGMISAIALSLLGLSIPRFVASVVMFGAADVRQRLQLGQEIRAEDAEFAGPIYERALGWFEDPAWLAEWGHIQLDAGLDLLAAVATNLDDAAAGGDSLEVQDDTALQPTDDRPANGDEFADLADAAAAPLVEEAYEAIENAIVSFEAALAQRPSDAETWYQLAYARLLFQPDDTQGWQALVASIRGAPATPSLVFERLEFAFWQWDAIDKATYKELPEQYMRALELDPETFGEMVEAYERSGDVWPIVLPRLEKRLRDAAVMGWPY